MTSAAIFMLRSETFQTTLVYAFIEFYGNLVFTWFVQDSYIDRQLRKVCKFKKIYIRKSGNESDIIEIVFSEVNVYQ